MIAALGAPLLLAFTSPLPAGSGASSGWPEVDAQVVAAKGAMMAEPQVALGAARNAGRLAGAHPASPARDKAVATAGWLEGEALIRVNRPVEAAPVIESALKQAQAVAPGSKLEGDLLKARGALASAQGRVQAALTDLQQAYRVYQHADVPRSEAIALQDIGSIYSDAHDYEHMIKYYRQSSDIYKADPAVMLVAHNNLGSAELRLNQYDAALRDLSAALNIARQMKSPSTIARVLRNQAQAQVGLGQYDAAQASLREAFAVGANDPSAKGWTPFLWGVQAQLDLKRGRIPDARSAIEKAFAGQDLAKTGAEFREFHETAWRVYTALGESDRALAHLAAFKRLDDQARDLAASTNAALMGAQFDFANQDLKIAQRDVALARARGRAQTTLLWSVVAGAGLVLAFVLVGFLAMRRSRDAIRSANRRLESANGALERALKAKSQFLATTSHEIRTPLNGILGMTQVLLADRSLAEPVRGRVELVHGAGETMRALVDDILDLAKMETGRITVEKRPFDLQRLIDETSRLWRAEAQNKGLTLTLDAEHLPAAIVEDQGRLRQVLFNLMSNAIKFTDVGGVTLRIRRLEGQLTFQVVDTGIGIDPADAERVFEAFTQVDGGTTRRHGGTGLGLAICRDVAAALGGEVTLASRLGEGATFTLVLPMVEAEGFGVAAASEAKEGGPRSLAESRVLVLEPNPLARSVMRAVLQANAAHVEAAADLAQAREALGQGDWGCILVAAEALGAEPGAAGRALHDLVHAAGGAVVSVLATQPSGEMSAALLRSGVSQMLMRPIASDALVAALGEAVAAGVSESAGPRQEAMAVAAA